jgi:hypothetical protein
MTVRAKGRCILPTLSITAPHYTECLVATSWGHGEFNFFIEPKASFRSKYFRIIARCFCLAGFLLLVASQDRIAPGDVQGALHAPRSSKYS